MNLLVAVQSLFQNQVIAFICRPTHYKTHTYAHPHIRTPTHYKTHTYTHPHITKPTHTHTHTLQNPHIRTPTHYKTQTYTHSHITKQVNTTTVQDTQQHHDSVSLYSRNEYRLGIEGKDGWTSGTDWKLWRRDKSVTSGRNRTTIPRLFRAVAWLLYQTRCITNNALGRTRKE